jgi:tetratricopeptide (TPR) repeat protein
LGEAARGRGDYALARKLYEEALEEASERNPVPLFNLGQVALSQGDCTAAHGYFVRTLRLSAKLGYRTFVAHALEGVAEVIALQGEPGRALRLLGAANTVRQAINTPIEPADLPEYDRALATARAALGEAAFAAAWAEGQAMTTEQAIKLGIEPVTGSATDESILLATP